MIFKNVHKSKWLSYMFSLVQDKFSYYNVLKSVYLVPEGACYIYNRFIVGILSNWVTDVFTMLKAKKKTSNFCRKFYKTVTVNVYYLPKSILSK